jgi:SAM-dependent methyltransferase
MRHADHGPRLEPRAGALWGAAWSAIPIEVARRLEAGGATLEVGCGRGLACLALAEDFPAARVTGHDPDPLAIAQATVLARAAGLEPRLRFAVDDSTRLPRAAFDLVTVCSLVVRPCDPRRLLNAIRNALVPEGICLLLEPGAVDAARRGSAIATLRSLSSAAGFSRFRAHPEEGRLHLFELAR